MDFTEKTIGFIGAGQMGFALIKGILQKAVFQKEAIFAAEPNPERREYVEKETGITLFESASECVGHSDIVVLAVKPQIMDLVLGSMAHSINQEHLIVSIAAGISTAFIEKRLPPGTRVVRVMPNTPALVHQGASAVAPGSNARDEDVAVVLRIFEAVGVSVRVPETMMDAVTGLSGSGPAYCFQFIDALIMGGILEGLPRDIAERLAIQTVLGSAKLMLETGKHPGELISMVTSPGGTTIRGLKALESYGFTASVMEAVSQATKRSKELGEDN